jgi:hypothetical protein
VLLGIGDGTFKPAVEYGSGGYFATSVAVADVSGDGKHDLLVTNQCVNSNDCSQSPIGVLLGNGDGTFQSAVTYFSGGMSADSVAVAYVNGDAKPDLVVANQYFSAVGVLLGNRDGTFQAAVAYPPDGINAVSVAVADVNGDGKADLLVVSTCADFNCRTGTVGVLVGVGDGSFQPAVNYDSGGNGPDSVAVADVNGDGKPDLMMANYSVNFYEATPGVVTVLLNNGVQPTTTTLVSSVNPAAVQQGVTFTATVTGQPGQTVTGTVTFREGASDVGTVTVARNQAAYSTSYRVHGLHALAAIYSGDLHNSASTSATLNEYIGTFPVPSRTTLTTSGSPSLTGQAVAFTATVALLDPSYGPIPSGESVTFYDGTNILGSRTLLNGTAAYSTPSLSAKTHTIKATTAEMRYSSRARGLSHRSLTFARPRVRSLPA